METRTAEETFTAYFEGIKTVKWTNVWYLSDGTRIVLRPVQPQDSPLLSAMMARLSSQTKYNRFHGAVNNLTSTHLRYLSCVDQQRHVAFVLTMRENGQEHIIADARYVVDQDTNDQRAEFAIMVEDLWQRFGLAERAMHALTAAACSNGLRWLHGDVLADNCPMLALMQRCHFCCTPDISDEKMVHAEISLSPNARRLAYPPSIQNLFGYLLPQWIKSARDLFQQLLRGGRYV